MITRSPILYCYQFFGVVTSYNQLLLNPDIKGTGITRLEWTEAWYGKIGLN